MSEQGTPSAAPGWYPDPQSPGDARYWDGSAWGPAGAAPSYQAPPPLRAPEGTDPNTVWIWILVALPILSVVPLFFIPWQDYFATALGDPTDPRSSLQAQLSLFTSPGYIASIVLSLVTWAATVVLAYLDHRTLLARNLPKPFHWALTFIPSYGQLIYIIGRSVVVRGRTGRGLGPLWVTIALFVLGIVLTIVFTVYATNVMFDALDDYPYR